MATVSTAKQGDPIGSALYTLTETSTTATAVNMDGSAGSIVMVEIDNSSGNLAVHLNLYDAGSATAGSTVEDFVFMAPAGARVTYSCPEGAAYGTGLWGAIVSTAGSAIGPGYTVNAYILANP